MSLKSHYYTGLKVFLCSYYGLWPSMLILLTTKGKCSLLNREIIKSGILQASRKCHMRELTHIWNCVNCAKNNKYELYAWDDLYRQGDNAFRYPTCKQIYTYH